MAVCRLIRCSAAAFAMAALSVGAGAFGGITALLIGVFALSFLPRASDIEKQGLADPAATGGRREFGWWSLCSGLFAGSVLALSPFVILPYVLAFVFLSPLLGGMVYIVERAASGAARCRRDYST